ncbi:NAD(P)-dependent oxidoreductase [Microcella indica]|uniref:NAD(P)-dependent oxidoreductase n=1 Tax=Microcella indica TaxID=2750620 RepID=UPI0015CEF702|nr:NAD(P)-dependent oxidoreductase [Microcella indica]
MVDVKQPSVGFLGLGEMGSAMAGRLLDGGLTVTAWNRSHGPAARLGQRDGVTVVPTVAAAFMAEQVVHPMLSDDSVVLEVFDEEMLSGVPAGRTHIQHATVSADTATELAEHHQRHGVGYVTAPVLGRSTVIARGDLLVVASGEPEALASAMPSLTLLGRQVWSLGSDPRHPAVVKIGVNYSIVHTLQSIAESVSLVESAGVGASSFVEILTDTAFSGSAHRGYGPMIAESRYQPVGFSMALGLKDLTLAEQTAAEQGVKLPMSSVLREVFEATMADPDLAALDWSAVAEITRGRRAR